MNYTLLIPIRDKIVNHNTQATNMWLLNITKCPSSSCAKLGTLKSGTKVEIVGTDSKTSLYKIKYKNSYGYVSNDYINL